MVEEIKVRFFLAHRQLKGYCLVFPFLLAMTLTVACQQDPVIEQRPEPSPAVTQIETTPIPSMTPAQVQPTATLLAIATANYLPIPAAPPLQTDGNLVIDLFEINSAEEMGSGKKVALSWHSNGRSARLISGAGRSNPPWWSIPASGTMTVELEESLYADPPFTLQVFDAADLKQAIDVTEATVPFQWPCRQSYFFEPSPALCPAGEPIVGAAAEQPFENGVMIWLAATDAIYVLDRREASWQRFEDTWSEEQPESDLAIVPPADRFQPIRGFGKVWRERPGVREALGWALGVELGFPSIFQAQAVPEGQPEQTYLRTFNGQVFGLIHRGLDEGDWVLAADNR